MDAKLRLGRICNLLTCHCLLYGCSALFPRRGMLLFLPAHSRRAHLCHHSPSVRHSVRLLSAFWLWGSAYGCFGGYSSLPAPIHARLCGWAGTVCPEQNHSPNLKCMLIVSYIDDSGPDRNANSVIIYSP